MSLGVSNHHRCTSTYSTHMPYRSSGQWLYAWGEDVRGDVHRDSFALLLNFIGTGACTSTHTHCWTFNNHADFEFMGGGGYPYMARREWLGYPPQVQQIPLPVPKKGVLYPGKGVCVQAWPFRSSHFTRPALCWHSESAQRLVE